MPNKCCEPTCKNGYESEKLRKAKEGEIDEVHFFKFPDHKTEPPKRAEWIAKVPRDDWTPDKKEAIWICELHFQETDFIRFSTDSNPRRKRKKTSNGTWTGNFQHQS